MTAEELFLDCIARMEREGKHRECCWVFPEPDDVLSSWVARDGDKENNDSG